MTPHRLIVRSIPPPSVVRSSRRRPRAILGVERLESREVKDAGIALVAGAIDIAGASSQNTVVVSYTDSSQTAISVTWNNTTVAYPRAQVTSILFTGQGGFNSFYNFTNIASTATGGNGVNLFYGGTGADTFTGGDGLNLFWGNGTNDTLIGGNGTNIFTVAPSASDTLVGGNGVNIFMGVAGGNDSVTVGTGFNLLD